MKTFYVTTPIYYANSTPHIGHVFASTAADVMARRARQRGLTTYFLTGTDEHGINVQRAAEREGRTPKEHVDLVVAPPVRDGFQHRACAQARANVNESGDSAHN